MQRSLAVSAHVLQLEQDAAVVKEELCAVRLVSGGEQMQKLALLEEINLV